MRNDLGRGQSKAWLAPDGRRFGAYGGTFACTPELIEDNVEVAVAKRKPMSEAERETEGERPSGAWHRGIDGQLAVLYQAALEEPIPNDILQLVEQIGSRQSRN